MVSGTLSFPLEFSLWAWQPPPLCTQGPAKSLPHVPQDKARPVHWAPRLARHRPLLCCLEMKRGGDEQLGGVEMSARHPGLLRAWSSATVKVAQNTNCERGAVGSSSSGFLERQLQEKRFCCQGAPLPPRQAVGKRQQPAALHCAGRCSGCARRLVAPGTRHLSAPSRARSCPVLALLCQRVPLVTLRPPTPWLQRLKGRGCILHFIPRGPVRPAPQRAPPMSRE